MRRFGAPFAAMMLALAGAAAAAQHGGVLFEKLRGGGHVVLLRHALAPGTGDPQHFELGDCSTQRNLDDAGRAQARRIGERFRAHGIAEALVYTSEWCRCRETARLLGLGEPRALPFLNSFFEHRERSGPQTQALREWLAGRDRSRPVVLVTHQVNITAYTGVHPRSGEMVLVKPAQEGAAEVVGTIETDS